jgi:hypothetical protein
VSILDWFGPSKCEKERLFLIQLLIIQGENIMATLAEIKQEVIDQKIKIEALIVAFNALKDNTTPGPGPGEVVVKQEDIDAIDAVVDETTAEIPAV